MVILSVTAAAAGDLQLTKISPVTSNLPAANDWNGYYVGGHLGYMAAPPSSMNCPLNIVTSSQQAGWEILSATGR